MWHKRVDARIRNLGTLFFVHLITCLRTLSRTSHFVHLKWSFGHASALMCTSPCTYYKHRHVFYLQSTINVFQIYFLIPVNDAIFCDDL